MVREELDNKSSLIMFYKKENNGNWLCGIIVKLPTGEKMNSENKLNLDGWEWHDTPPQEYLKWEKEQDELEI